MKIEDYNITSSCVFGNTYECLLTHSGSNTTYGIQVQGNAAPPKEWVFNLFQQKPKDFFIEATIIKSETTEIVKTS